MLLLFFMCAWAHSPATQQPDCLPAARRTVAYLNILADLFSSVAGTIIPAGAEPNRNLLLLGVTLAGCLPVTMFVRSPSVLGAVSQASVACLLAFSAGTALLAVTGSPTGPLLWWRMEGVLVSFPIVIYGFTAHQVLFSVYSSMQRASLKRMTGVIQKSMVLSSGLYILVGACGYLAFGQK